MRKNIFVFMIFGACVSLPTMAYNIGEFTAPKGADGAACNATITTERCGPNLSTKCGQDSAKSGIKMTRTDCNGGNATSFYTYDGDVGTGIYYQGELANCDALNALKNNSNVAKEPGYAWFVKNLGTGYDAGKLYIWTDNTFPDCPSGGVPFQGPQGAQGDGVCTGLENSDTAVKNTTLTYSGPTKSDNGLSYYTTKGKMTTNHTPCNPSATIDDTVQDDSCTLIAAPSGSTCTGSKKAYYECKTQATDGSLAKGAIYNLCVSTAGDSISNALDGKEDTACVGSNSNSASVERKKTVSYTAPTGSGTVKTGVGKVVNKSVKCDNSETTISSTPDKCEEIAKPNGVCTASGKVYYKCTQQNDGTEYNLCADGNSVLSAVGTAVAAVDPCASVANGNDAQKKAQIKSMNSTYTLQTVSSGNDRTAVGYSTVTKTTCATGADATQVEYQYDTCKEIADTRTSGACSGNDKVYLECVNQTKGASDSGYTYKVCQTVTANTSLSGKITAAQTAATNAATAAAEAQTAAESKISASYLTTNGYLTSNSNLNAGKLTGTINAGRLPDTVVTVGDDATHGLNTLLATKKYVTESGLESAVSSAVSEKTVTFGNLQITLDEALELVGKAAGTCTRTSSGGDSENAVSCSNGALGSVSTTGKNPGN